MTLIYILLASIITSLISLLGILVLTVSKNNLNRLIMFLVSFSAGTLIGDTFFHLLPEAVAKNNGLELWITLVAGVLLFFVLEKIVHWRHCHLSPNENHPHPVGMMNLVGDGLHNLIDGFIIAGSFLVDFRLGIVTTIAVIAHEIPQELGDFGTLLHAGYKPKRALALNLLSASFSVIGAVLAWFFGTNSQGFIDLIIPLTAGSFIYIATADLIPELKKEVSLLSGLRQFAGIILGLGIMLLLKFIIA
ncbi:MAG TPA: ZIP family metal transporter [bacterium]|nr:ZIP family metal transporter [bacterium]HPT29609.1 ZIP family metal transporter [bacterium]